MWEGYRPVAFVCPSGARTRNTRTRVVRQAMGEKERTEQRCSLPPELNGSVGHGNCNCAGKLRSTASVRACQIIPRVWTIVCSVRNILLSLGEPSNQNSRGLLPCFPSLHAEIIHREQTLGQQGITFHDLKPGRAFLSRPPVPFTRGQRTLRVHSRQLLQRFQVSTVQTINAFKLPGALHDSGVGFAAALAGFEQDE